MSKIERVTTQESKGKSTSNCARPPIVTILGHVDHGKTTILDKIRESDVQGCEAGGITQKVSLFTVEVKDGQRITFVDTPGHEAFDLMRSRGRSIADIVLLVVAADDGVKPQTKESIDIINNSDSKPIVVINKCDLPNISLEKVKREIVNNGLQLEGFGGDIPVIEVSARTGKGISELIDLILLVAEVEGIKSTEELPKGILGKAYVLESIKDKYKGNTSSIALTQGSACQGNWIGYKIDSNVFIEKAKAIITEEGENLCIMDCGCGGKIIGISNLLKLGTTIYILESKNKDLLDFLFEKEDPQKEDAEVTLEEFFSAKKEDSGECLNVIIKSSSQGSLEAIINSLNKIKEDEYWVNIVDSGVGTISLRDIELAELSRSIVLGFEVGIESGVVDYAKKKRILVKTYDIIYKLIEEVLEALSLMALPSSTEEEIGSAVVKTLFTLSDGSVVLGSRVSDGYIKRDCKVDIVRGDEIIAESKVKSLRINKDSVNEVKSGFDCGIQLLDSSSEVREGDKIYCHKVVK